MGQLQSTKRSAPRRVNQEAFSGALDLAIEMLRQAGEPLQFGSACRLLDAAAWMQVQLSEQQAAALEAAVVAGLTSGAKLKSNHMRWMLSAYIRLGLQPGPELAAALAPGQCLVTAEVRCAAELGLGVGSAAALGRVLLCGGRWARIATPLQLGAAACCCSLNLILRCLGCCP